jgi:hypothetical protein
VPVILPPATVQEALNADPEFRLAARYWTARIKLTIGEGAYFLKITDGAVTSVSDTPTGFDSYTIEIGGPESDWEEILAEVPRPFYQDFFSAFLRHGFTLAGDLELLYAYYGAVRRMAEVLRAINLQEA